MMNTAALAYGADLTGMICGYLFQPGQTGRSLASAELERWLHQAEKKPGEFVWLHFNFSHAASEKWLQRHAALPEQFFEALHAGSRATSIEYADDSLVAVLNDVHFNFSFDESQIATLWAAVSPHSVVTGRTKPLRSVDRLREAVKHGEPLRSAVEVLVHLLRDEADVLIQIVRDLADRVDHVEDLLLGNRLDNRRNELGSYRRLLNRLQRLLAPEPSALFRLLSRPPRWVREVDLQELRQSTEEFSAVLRDMASLQERIKLLQEEIAAQINQQNNRSLYVLTMVTVLALPINLVAGLLGMNVGGIPLSDASHGFWVIAALVAGFTAVAGSLLFRRRGD